LFYFVLILVLLQSCGPLKQNKAVNRHTCSQAQVYWEEYVRLVERWVLLLWSERVL